jgi:peroxiredoxin
MNDAERAYNSEDFAVATPAAINPGETMAAKVGVAAPDFEAVALDGRTVRLSEFRDKRHVVIMTGAVTSPMCAFEYTRESHPAEHYSAHQSFEQKLAYARDLQRLEGVRVPFIVDHLDGRIHRAYGVWPNALFVIHKDGRLIFRSNMTGRHELREFIDSLLAAEKAAAEGRVTHLQYSERVLAHEADQATHRRVYERAGPKAFEDYWVKRPQNRNRWP